MILVQSDSVSESRSQENDSRELGVENGDVVVLNRARARARARLSLVALAERDDRQPSEALAKEGNRIVQRAKAVGSTVEQPSLAVKDRC